MGTPVTVMTDFPPVISCEPVQNQDALEIEETIGNRFPTGLDYGTRFFNVPIEFAPRPASFGRILSGFLGLPATTGSGPYTHLFDPVAVAAADDGPEPHTIAVSRKDPNPAIVDFFGDCIGDQLELTMAANDYMRATATYIGKALDDEQSAPAVTIDATPRFKFSQILVYINLAGAGEAAVVCRDAKVTYSNSIDTDEAVLGSRELYALPFGNANCEVTFSVRESLAAYYREAMKADPTQSKIRLVATGASPYVFEVDLYEVEFTEAPAPVSGADVLKAVEVTARARYSTSLTKFVDFKLINSTASYAA
jgi:hypothetical protein